MLRKTLCLASLIPALLLNISAHAQEPAPLHYDVVSIKPNTSDSGNMSWRTNPDSFSTTGMTLTVLIMSAYDTRDDLISGIPAWAQKDHFDLSAKITDADPEALKKLTPQQHQAMIAEILADRFHLKIHPEIKQLPVYDLVLAKDGSRLKPNAAVYEKNPAVKPKEGMAPGGYFTSTGEFTGVAVPLSSFVGNLASNLQRNVIDKTGLTANYDIHLKWTPEGAAPAGPDSARPDPAPPLFTALQEQLGLKLVPAKGPVQTWVVDHVDHPTEN